jgi:hypothetical protein
LPRVNEKAMDSPKIQVQRVPDGPSIQALIADAIQSANIERPCLGFGKPQDQIYLSNEDSDHAATAIVERLAAFGYEIRKKDG